MHPRLLKLDATTRCANEDAFARRYQMKDDVARRLWEVLEDSKSVLLELPPSRVKRACNLATKRDTRINRGLIAKITNHGQNNGTAFEITGATVCDVHEKLVRRDEARDRLAEIKAGEIDENPDGLETAIEKLDWRASSQKDLETSFSNFWITESEIENAYVHADPVEVKASGFQKASFGVQ